MNYQEAISIYEAIPYDYSKITSEELNLSNGRNKSLFNYKGQFSPDLVKHLLIKYSQSTDVILDPFMGCGTTLQISAQLNKECVGVDINQAAVDMARLLEFSSINHSDRMRLLNKIDIKLTSIFRLKQTINLNDYILICKQEEDETIKVCLLNALILILQKEPEIIELSFSRVSDFFTKIKNILTELPVTNKKITAFHKDARNIPSSSDKFNLIVTSPPYINVFNYHQHFRRYLDLVYGNTLEIAKSEFGSNRKNRQNRFLTVVQYILDLSATFQEMNRVLVSNGRIIFVIGRSSKVRGIDFRNDYIISAIGLNKGFKIVTKQERVFRNNFGKSIYEEIIHFEKVSSQMKDNARDLAAQVLQDKLCTVDTSQIADIRKALEDINKVNLSPII